MKRFKIASNRRLRTLLLLLVALGSTGIWIAAYGTHLLRSLELSTVNTRFSIRGHQKAPKNIVVVNVDAATFQDLNKQWPFPRAVDGRVLANIAKQHPAAVAFDVQLSEPSALGQNDDLALLNDIQNAGGKAIFADNEPDSKGNVAFLGSGEGKKLLGEVGARAADGSFPTDPGGVIRRTRYAFSNLKTLDVVAAEVAVGHRVSPKDFPGGSAWIDFRGPAGTYPAISFSHVYYGTQDGTPHGKPLPSNFFRNKIVIVGASATNLQDIHPSSTDSFMPGPEIHANAIDTILRGFPLSVVPGWVNVLLIVLMGVAVPLASLRIGPVASVGLAVGLGIVFAIVAQLAFNAGSIVSFVYPLGALLISSIGSISVQLVTEAFERIRTRDLFSRFVPENVVDEVLADSGGLRLGGVQRAGTVMFTDLRGFTSFAESLTPSQVIEVLNHYLSEMSDAILDHGGTLVAYMGDGIFAVFGAPLEMSDHADRALDTARELLEVRLPRFNEWIRSQGLGDGFRMGIGLNTGNVMSGHVGSERRVEYAAVGDTTNTASRLESMTKGTPHQLFLSDSTREALQNPPEDLVYVDEVDIRGRVNRLKLWSIREQEAEEAPAEPAQQPEPVS